MCSSPSQPKPAPFLMTRVFGLLGLMPKATAVSLETFFADYTQSPLELFQQVVLHFSRHERVDEPKRINESSTEMRRLRDEENLQSLHLLAQRMVVDPPHSRRMVAALYLNQEIFSDSLKNCVSDSEMQRLFPLKSRIVHHLAGEYYWDPTEPDAEQELKLERLGLVGNIPIVRKHGERT